MTDGAGGGPPPPTSSPVVLLSVVRFADISAHTLGGAILSMTLNTAALRRAGHDVSLVLSEDLAPRVSTKLRRFVVPWVILLEVVRRQWRGQRPDVVEVHEPSGAAYAWARRHLPWLRLPPLVVMSHGPEARYWQTIKSHGRPRRNPVAWSSRVSVPLTRLTQAWYALTRASQVMVLSSDDRAFLLSRYRLPPERVTLVRHGVDADVLPAARTPSVTTRLLFAGPWMETKGIYELIEAWSFLAPRHEQLSLSLVGVMVPVEEVLDDFPAGVRSRITVQRCFARDELPRILAHADIFVLPSWFEGMPLSALEAAGAGLAVVASAVGGLKDIFRPSDPEADGAILVPPRSPWPLAAAIELLVTDGDLLARLQRAARDRARAFSWECAAEQTVAVYGRAMAAADQRPPTLTHSACDHRAVRYSARGPSDAAARLSRLVEGLRMARTVRARGTRPTGHRSASTTAK